MGKMMKRQIIQVTSAATGAGEGQFSLVALCNDGTIWQLCVEDDEFVWDPLPGVPQSEH